MSVSMSDVVHPSPQRGSQLSESAIRSALLRRVRNRWANGSGEGQPTLIVEEFGTHYGAARIDLAVVNGSLRGYEIKSAADRLNRLPSQVRAFTDIFDEVTLVVTPRHFDDALRFIPAWWEVILATSARSGPRLRRVVRGRRNKATNAGAVARLLWRDELLAALRVLGNDEGVRSSTRDRLADRLVESTTQGELGRLVRQQIKARPGWRDDQSRIPGGVMSRQLRMSSGFLARRLR